MPTARELLEQADALMRRNRGGDIPVLSEPVSEALSATLRGPTTRDRGGPHLSPEAESAAVLSTEAEDLTVALDRSLQDDVEPPVLTDVVEEVAVDIVPMPAAKSEEDWLGPDTVDPELHSITGPSPDTVAVVPPVTLRSASEVPVGQAAVAEMSAESAQSAALEIAEPAAALVPPEAVSSPGPTDDERWRALAEQISMQVLQRVDLFVDTGLKAKLAAHLQPIVERAGNELVEAINDQVGQLVRSYVAEAIEREIAQWRQGQR